MRHKDFKVYEKAAEKLERAGSEGVTPKQLEQVVRKVSSATASKLAWGVRTKLGLNVVALRDPGEKRIKRYKIERLVKKKAVGFKRKKQVAKKTLPPVETNHSENQAIAS